MADILLELGIDLTQANADVKRAAGNIKQQFEQVKPKLNVDGSLAQKSVNQLTTSFQKYSKEVNMSQTQMKQAMAQMKLQGQSGSDAYNRMKTELIQANKEARLLQQSLDSVDKELDQIGANKGISQAATGVQSTRQSVMSSIGSSLGGGLLAGGAAGAALAGVSMLKEGIQQVISIGMDYQTALADFSALTGISGEALDNFGEMAQKAAEKFGGNAIDQITTFKGILSRLGPDIANTPEALDSMTNSINLLAKASGLDAETSMQALTTAALQFGVDLSNPIQAADEMARMMNVMAAGAKEGAAEVPQIASALEVAGSVAKSANVSFEETNAAIQVLATRGKYGSEAGTALRNVLGQLAKGRFLPKDTMDELKAAGVNTDIMSDKTKTLAERMAALQPIANDSALMTKFFNVENVVAGKALLENSELLGEFTKKMTGTQTASEQAAINMNTFGEQINRLKASIDGIKIEVFKGLAPIAQEITKAFGGDTAGIFEGLKAGIQSVMAFIQGAVKGGALTPFIILWERLKSIFALLGNVINTVVKPFQALAGETANTKNVAGGLGEAFGFFVQVLNSIQKPIQWLIDGLNAVISVTGDVLAGAVILGKYLFDNLYNAILKPIGDFLSGAFTAAWNGIKSVIQSVGEFIVNTFNQIKSFFSGLINIVLNFTKPIRDVISNIANWFKGLFDGIYNGIKSVYNKVAGILGKEKLPDAKVEVKTEVKDKIEAGDVLDANIPKALDETSKAAKEQKTELQKLEEQYKKLFEELGKLEQGSDKFNKKLAEASKVKENIDALKKSITELEKEISEFADKMRIEKFLTTENLGLSQIDVAGETKYLKEKLQKELNQQLSKLKTDKKTANILGDDTTGIDKQIKEIEKKLQRLEVPDLLRDKKLRVDGLDIIKQVSIGSDLQLDEATKKKLATELNAKLKDLKQQKIELEFFGEDTSKVNEEIDSIQKKLDKLDVSGVDLTSPFTELNGVLESTKDQLQNVFGEMIAGFLVVEEEVERQTEKLNNEYKEQTSELRKKLSVQEMAYDDFRQAQAEADSAYLEALKENEKETNSIYQKLAGVAIDTAVEVLNKMIPIWTAQIFGTEVAKLGFAGIATAAALTATLLGLSTAAKSVLGAEGGVVGLDGSYNKKPGRTDTIPFMLAKNESVITASGTGAKGNKEFFEWVNRTGGSIYDYIQGGYYSDNKDVVKELRAVRNELNNAKLVETYNNNKIIIEDNRPVKVKRMKWSGR